MDLIQVEGLSDLLRAETEAQRKISFDQLDGVISKKLVYGSQKLCLF